MGTERSDGDGILAINPDADGSVQKMIAAAEIKYAARRAKEKPSRFLLARILYLALGFISLGLGAVGIFFPILPTVPFFLVAAFCLVRGSEKFGKWFMSTRLYRRHLYIFRKYHAMTLFGELLTITVICLLFIASSVFSGSLAMAIIGPVICGFHIIYFSFRVTPISKAKMNMIYDYENSPPVEDGGAFSGEREDGL
ncbi:MAG: YbaN family protein [Clostridiales bacterium]|jgi:uncharacterized membrane protein YbaN (DUF454 family)|nr:YbaN family protein [Clostridiales bacterium]